MATSKHPDQIGAYRVEKMIGRGAMGVVYAARHQQSGQQVAIKTLQPKRLSGTIEAAIERFAHEVIAMSSLQHPGIVRVFDWDRVVAEELGEVLFFAMELLEGETLEAAVKRGPFFAPEACAIVLKIAEALQAAHAQGIVHRDIKPANVFLTRDRRVVITDFGVCKLSNVRPVTTVGSFIGTAPFLAPEVVQQGEVDHRADIFSLGALFYNLLTRGFLRPISSIGELLFSITQGEEVNRVRQLQGFDQRIVDILVHCVERDPERRFQQVDDVAHHLVGLAGPIPAPGQRRALAPVPETPYAAQDAAAFRAPSTVVPLPQKKRQRPDWLTDSSADPFGSSLSSQDLGASQLGAREKLFDSQGLESYTIDGEAFEALPSDPMISMAGVNRAAKARVYLSQEAVLETGQGGGPHSAAFAYFGLTPDVVAYLDRRAALLRGEIQDRPPGPTPEQQAALAARADSIDVGMLELDLALERKVQGRLPWRLIGTVAAMALVAGVGFIGLRARPVELPIRTEPPGAAVLIDGQMVGFTPMRHLSRRSRTPSVELQAPDREPFRTQVSFPLFGEVAAISVELPLSPATLQLRSTPRGAVVTVDSAAACRTPCAVTSLVPQRKHLVAIEREGCAPATFVLEAEPATSLEREVTLAPLGIQSLALVRVLVDGGRVELDGEDVTALAHSGPFFVFGGEHLLRAGAEREQGLTLKIASSSTSWIDLRAAPAPPPAPGAAPDPESPEAAHARAAAVDHGVYLLSQGRAAAAAAPIARALASDPADHAALRASQALALTRGDQKGALRHARALVALPRGSEDTYRVQKAIDATLKVDPCGEAVGQGRN